MLRPAGLFFQQAREGAPHYGHTLQNRDRTQAERRVHEAPDPQRRAGRCHRLGSRAAYRGHQEDLGLHQKHNLQDASNKRNINADAKLRPIFGKDQVTMFELTKLVNAHLK
ncbi:hypothetical protein BP082_02991 [Bordetella pertussis]|nr:hypothetical protein BP082_02991 [Bordetella pertussis]